jgi:DNA-binding XRE family transcriptional regulator
VEGKPMRLCIIRKRPPFPAVYPPVPTHLSLGFAIRRVREICGVTQSDLARLAGANLSYISTVESGVNNISIRKMLQICNALRMPPSLLLDIQQNVSGSASLSGP